MHKFQGGAYVRHLAPPCQEQKLPFKYRNELTLNPNHYRTMKESKKCQKINTQAPFIL
jgi:hypothetical protein